MGEKVSGKIHESASNLLTVKSLGLKGNIGKRTGYYEQKYHKTFLAAKMAGVAKSRTIKIFSAICNGLFLLMLGYATIRGDITVGMILVYYGYFGRVIGSAHEVTNSIGQYLHIKSLIGRFMTILGKNSIERDSPSLLKFPKNWKTIKFVNVDFKYKSKKVLNNFNLIIRRGDQIGFVGRSGCGKSTLVKLLMGLYHPSKGEILIDDVNLNKFRHSSITDNLGIVLQDSEMFNMSLKENICISSSKENPKLLRKALDVSNLRPVIKKLPNKLNTLVGEKGYKLSGGERQRVGIARAIYKNSSLMMLDETTSSLDSKTERIIQNNIEKKLKNKTLLTIAHRLSTLRNTERIIFMENGKISEEGSFKELVKMKKKFYKLYKLQKH